MFTKKSLHRHYFLLPQASGLIILSPVGVEAGLVLRDLTKAGLLSWHPRSIMVVVDSLLGVPPLREQAERARGCEGARAPCGGFVTQDDELMIFGYDEILHHSL